MLTIKRIPTVVSNYQEDTADADAAAAAEPAGCGRSCLGSCCLPLSMLPLYSFKRDSEITPNSTSEGFFFLDSLLLAQWNDRMNRGLFRYDVTACETKVIPGKHGFVAQLNEGRHLKKRPTEFRVDQVLQPFDASKFNFTKAGQEEVLLRFEPGTDRVSHFFETAPVDGTSSPSVVAINVSPIEYGHVLLIPRVLDCLPQRIDRETFSLALHLAAEAATPHFRVGYNSLGAFATINHLHFQAYYFSAPFPVEKAPTRRIKMTAGPDGGVEVSQLLEYPVRGLVFDCGDTLKDLSNAVANSCIYLQENNIPFNVLICKSGRRVFLFPQCYAEKQALGKVSRGLLDTQVNPAAWEIGGHMVLKRRKDYEAASEASAWRLLAEVSLSAERFQQVQGCIFDALGLVASEEENDANEKMDSSTLTTASFPHLQSINSSF